MVIKMPMYHITYKLPDEMGFQEEYIFGKSAQQAVDFIRSEKGERIEKIVVEKIVTTWD